MSKTTKFEIENIGKFASDLSDVVCKLTGLNDIIFEVEIKDARFGTEVLKIESNELVNYMYPKFFKSLKITNFGGSWDLKPGSDFYWLPLHYSYEHFSGGHNGSSICTLMLDKEGNIKEVRNELKERE